MSRSLVGLLAAIGVALSGLAGYAHGAFIWATIAGAATAGGLAAFLGFVSIKKKSSYIPTGMYKRPNGMHQGDRCDLVPLLSPEG
jgi:hypothetical protein